MNTDVLIPCEELRTLVTSRTCIVGVGNRQRGDDGVGPRVIDQRDPEAQGTWIDAGTAPENFLEQIVRSNPDAVVFIDAVDFGGSPGECRLLQASMLPSFAFATHGVAFSVFDEYLSARAGLQPRVLGIQPAAVRLGSRMSDPVARASTALAERLSQFLATTQLALQTERFPGNHFACEN